MKFIYTISFVIIIVFAQKADALDKNMVSLDFIKLTCVTSIPTTTFEATSDEKYVHLNITHHMGTKYIPIHSGTITINDLPMLKEKALVLAKLGNSIDVKFNREDCIVHGERLYTCYGKKKITIGEIKVDGFDFYTSIGTQRISGNIFSFVTLNFSISYNNTSYDISMDYYDSDFGNECSFN